MLGGVIIFVLIAAALIAAITARHIDYRSRRLRSDIPGPAWTPLRERIDSAHPLLDELTITRFGYDRQVHRAGTMVRNGRERILVQYSFVSGFGENRQQFHCMILACPIDATSESHDVIITADDRIASAGFAPGWRRSRQNDRWWITNDSDALARRYTQLANWVNRQPADRTVEAHPGLIAIYQSGPLTTDAADSLSAAVDELMTLLAEGATKD